MLIIALMICSVRCSLALSTRLCLTQRTHTIPKISHISSLGLWPSTAISKDSFFNWRKNDLPLTMKCYCHLHDVESIQKKSSTIQKNRSSHRYTIQIDQQENFTASKNPPSLPMQRSRSTAPSSSQLPPLA